MPSCERDLSSSATHGRPPAMSRVFRDSEGYMPIFVEDTFKIIEANHHQLSWELATPSKIVPNLANIELIGAVPLVRLYIDVANDYRSE